MHFFPLTIACNSCGAKCNFRGFAYSADGELKFTLWCTSCEKECHYQIYDTNLRNWAFKLDYPDKLVPCDEAFLHEMLVSWEEPKQLTQPPRI